MVKIQGKKDLKKDLQYIKYTKVYCGYFMYYGCIWRSNEPAIIKAIASLGASLVVKSYFLIAIPKFRDGNDRFPVGNVYP